MSAFIVGHDHIDALLSFAVGHAVRYRFPGGDIVEITTANATETGRILLLENERSVNERYNETDHESSQSYTFKPWRGQGNTPPISILKGCDCFDYQACETDDYEETLAALIIRKIRDRAISYLPGYDDAKGWEFRR